MRTVVFVFDTQAEANAFAKGVTWVNDGAIDEVEVERPNAVAFTDADGEGDEVRDYRNSVTSPPEANSL